MTEPAGDAPPDPERDDLVPVRARPDLRRPLVVSAVLIVLAGIVFPAIVLTTARLLFPYQAGGSLVLGADGAVLGSERIGQAWSGPGYFHGRPSAAGMAGYDAAASSGLNLGPTNPDLLTVLAARAAEYRALNAVAPDTPLPADAVTTSASGLDPDISPANARLQVARVAAARDLPAAIVAELVEGQIEAPLLGFIGEPRVNVLRLNLALDELGAVTR
jgi:K+-transporting ATPase ATPase C chain